MIGRTYIPVHHFEMTGDEMDPQYWFSRFTFDEGLNGAIAVLKDAVSSLKLIGFSVAFAATTIYICGYILSGSPQKRAEYKNRVTSLYVLVVVLFGGLGLADLLYDIAVAIGGA